MARAARVRQRFKKASTPGSGIYPVEIELQDGCWRTLGGTRQEYIDLAGNRVPSCRCPAWKSSAVGGCGVWKLRLVLRWKLRRVVEDCVSEAQSPRLGRAAILVAELPCASAHLLRALLRQVEGYGRAESDAELDRRRTRAFRILLPRGRITKKFADRL